MVQRSRERCYTRKRIRLEDVSYSDPNMVYFVTICVPDNKQVFASQELADKVIESLMWCRENGRFLIYAYCLMPEHLHVALSPGDAGQSLSDSIGRFKSFTENAAHVLGVAGQLWQRSWYDHIARRDEDVVSICEYILENPLRRGLVESTEEWPYCGMLDPLPW